MSVRSQQPRIYFSFRSPYSWLTYHDLVTDHLDLAEQLQWIPFWEPDTHSERMLSKEGANFPYTSMSRAKHFYILQDVRRLTSERGLQVKWPLDRDPQWEVPHLAYIVAARQGRGAQLIKRVYEMRWQEGRDICDRDTIGELASEIGLNSGQLAAAADDSAVRREGLEALLSVCNEGVFGVPFFVVGREKFWGLDRVKSFIAALRQETSLEAASQEGYEPVLTTVERTTEWGHAGGCG